MSGQVHAATSIVTQTCLTIMKVMEVMDFESRYQRYQINLLISLE